MKSFFTLFLALFAVAAVVYLSYLFSRYIASSAPKPVGSRYMKVIDRIILGQDRMLLIVMIGESFYLISSGPQSMTLLKELPPHEVEVLLQEDPMQDANLFKSFQDTLKGNLFTKK